jgi:hypothetical protein
LTYVIRTCQQDLRIGMLWTTVLAALARAVVLHWHYTTQQSSVKASVSTKPNKDSKTNIVDSIASWDRVVKVDSALEAKVCEFKVVASRYCCHV